MITGNTDSTKNTQNTKHTEYTEIERTKLKHADYRCEDRSQEECVPCRQWWDSAQHLVNKAQQWIKSPYGKKARTYLYACGLTDKIIDEYKLGYIPTGKDGSWLKQSLSSWGLPITDPDNPYITLYEGILVPWYVGEQIWRLEVYKLTTPVPDQPKSMAIKGSRDIIYNINALKPNETVIVCDSSLDALAGLQACRESFTFVALGDIRNQEYRLWAQKCLQIAKHVLFVSQGKTKDIDFERFAGSPILLLRQHLPQSLFLMLWDKSLHAMLKNGIDFSTWLTFEIEHAKLTRMFTTPYIRPSRLKIAPETVQASARPEAGQENTELHAQRSPICCECGAPSKHFSPSGDGYCTEHYMCARGHVPQWVLSENNLWLCACVNKNRQRYL